MRQRHWGIWITVGIVLYLGIWGAYYSDILLLPFLEGKVNQELKGYTAHIRAVSFHPIGFSIDLLDMTIVQDAHPEPPVLQIPRLHASVQWRALLFHLRLVADFRLDRPTVYANLNQARAEIRSPTPLSQEGWQQALESIYPLKINEFEVRDARVTYVDRGPYRPLRLSHVNLHAENIRNIASPEHVYPSTIHMNGDVFDTGRLTLDGNANFLAVPHVTMKGDFSLSQVALDYFKPVTRHFNVSVQGGVLSTSGQFEYATKSTAIHIHEVSIQNVDLEYMHEQATAATEAQNLSRVGQSAKQISNNASTTVSVDKLDILKSTFGFRDTAASTPFRLYLTDADIHLTNVSNHSELGNASGSLTGKFMGSGATTIGLTLKPAGKSLDIDVAIKIEGTNLPSLNGLLRSYAGFDVASGKFSLYSQDRVRKGYLTGYIKPLFRDIQVSSPRTEAQKSFLQKLKERAIGVLAWILRNHPQHEVGTTVTLAGNVHSPKYSTWQAIGGLLKNAFIQPLRHRFGMS